VELREPEMDRSLLRAPPRIVLEDADRLAESRLGLFRLPFGR
jgi:hypothetical protein